MGWKGRGGAAILTLWSTALSVLATSPSREAQTVLEGKDYAAKQDISVSLFSSLERMSRVVDISYCVGTTGVTHPFACASRCKEFPTLTLITTWNTGVLMSDSCGYIAVDHGKRRPDAIDWDGEEDPMSEKAIIVAFRGTYSITNTVIDLSTVPQEYVPYPSPDDGSEEPPSEPEHMCDNCTVHMGFLASWREARNLVLPEVTRLKELHPDYRIHLVGHSLGGAVAMLAALELRVSLGWQNITVTTFGEPRVGNQGLCDYVDAVFGLTEEADPDKRSYRRVTHANDPVPLLPLSEWGFRSHAGEFFINKVDLSPSIEDLLICHGDHDEKCIGGGDDNYLDMIHRYLLEQEVVETEQSDPATSHFVGFPARLRLWQLFFAHRDYFWRLGLCVPGGDPANWGREKYGAQRNKF
jgi:hypothetical protein